MGCSIFASRLTLASLLTLLVLSPSAWMAAALPAGFKEEFVTSVRNPIDVIFLPPPGPGQQAPMLITDKSGKVNMWLNHETSDRSELIADISNQICDDGARGLMGIEVHPDFSRITNRWIYLFYTWKSGRECINRVSRFPVRADYTLNVSGEQVLVQFEKMFLDIHLGSDLAFGNDGNLWITSGDMGAPSKGDDALTQADNNLYGKLIRITPTGGVPGDNPYANDRNGRRCNRSSVGGNFKCTEVYAKGLRNPFKLMENMNTRGNKVEMRINDVGGALYEEVNDVGTDHPGVNYGWPWMEGPCNRLAGQRDLDCSLAGVRGFEDPVHWYGHDDQGGSIVAGAYVPNGVFPAEYDDTFFFTDYTDDMVYHMTSDPGSACRECNEPKSAYKMTEFFELNRIVELRFGPYKDTQALYILDRSRSSSVRRIVYTRGSRTNVAPTVKVTSSADNNSVLEGGLVTFDARGTTDPDSTNLSFSWNFGDGSPVVNSNRSPRSSHRYMRPGIYNVVLTVSDGEGGTGQARLVVQVGAVPKVTIQSPARGTTFGVGDRFPMRASATDFDGSPLPASAFTWEIRQHHNTHFHPYLDPTVGNNLLTRAAPPPEDFYASPTSFLKVLVTATNSLGLVSTTETVDIMPRAVNVAFTTNPPNIKASMVIFDEVIIAPRTVVLWENQRIVISASNVPGYRFAGWSDRGGQTHSITIPAGRNTLSFVASYVKIDDTGVVGGGGGGGDVALPLFINCGDKKDFNDGDNLWLSDRYFVGGRTGTTNSDILRTNDDRLYRRRRRGDLPSEGNPALRYNIPVGNGSYTVQLYFTEVSKQSANKRIFAIRIEGSLKEAAFDIFKEAGERWSPVMKEYTTTVTNNVLNIRLEYIKDRPEISGIAVYRSGGVVPSTPPPPPPTTGFAPFSVSINCGSLKAYKGFEADKFFSGGIRRPTALAVAGTMDDELYQMRREGTDIVYNIPVTSGRYKVDLYFVEFQRQRAGQRVFTIRVEGSNMGTSYDILDRAGFRAAKKETMNTNVNDGFLTIELLPLISIPVISGLTVTRIA